MKIFNSYKSQKSDTIFLLFILFSLFLEFCFNTKIHILEHPLNMKNNNLRQSNNRKKSINTDSIFSNVCLSIFDTYNFLGEKSLKIYQSCRDQYELLGMNDPEIIKNRPMCYESPNQFFCNYKIGNHKNESCEKIELIQEILSIIGGCLSVFKILLSKVKIKIIINVRD